MRKQTEFAIFGTCLVAAVTLFSIAFAKSHSLSANGYAAVRTTSPPTLLPTKSASIILNIAKTEYGNDVKSNYVLVEFGDYECPPCRMLENTVKGKTKAFGSNLKFVFKNYPLSFHPSAMPAALAAESAREQGKFWQMHDLLYTSPDLSTTGINKLATDLGLNLQKFEHDRSGVAKRRVLDDMRLFQEMKLQGTPSFILRLPNGNTYLMSSLRVCYALFAAVATSLASISMTKATKCKPATVSGNRS